MSTDSMRKGAEVYGGCEQGACKQVVAKLRAPTSVRAGKAGMCVGWIGRETVLVENFSRGQLKKTFRHGVDGKAVKHKQTVLLSMEAGVFVLCCSVRA